MQRSSSNVLRNALFVTIAMLVLMCLLYVIKRGEAGKLRGELNSLKVERRESDDGLNSKLNDFLHKIETMTRQLGEAQTKLTRVEDEKAQMAVRLQKAEQEKDDCLVVKQGSDQEHESMRAELSKIKELHNQVSDQLSQGQNDVQNIQTALRDSETELETCEDSRSTCEKNLISVTNQQQQCQDQLSACHLPSGGRARPPSYQPQQQPSYVNPHNSINPHIPQRPGSKFQLPHHLLPQVKEDENPDPDEQEATEKEVIEDDNEDENVPNYGNLGQGLKDSEGEDEDQQGGDDDGGGADKEDDNGNADGEAVAVDMDKDAM